MKKFYILVFLEDEIAFTADILMSQKLDATKLDNANQLTVKPR